MQMPCGWRSAGESAGGELRTLLQLLAAATYRLLRLEQQAWLCCA